MNDGSGIAVCSEVTSTAEMERLGEALASGEDFPQGCCKQLSRIFHVRDNEVALLCVHGNLLKFLFPLELKAAGTIPISGSAIAARTALTRKAELFNNFNKVRHVGVFETIKFAPAENEHSCEQQLIQKLMSAPIIDDEGKIWGIVQISRKGADPKSAGSDFTREDLQRLVQATRVIGGVVTNGDPTCHGKVGVLE
jgi:GAF domain-containing protein